ncbi:MULTISPECIES: PP0621 family protein [Pandoraea]|uniref:Deaminase n=1 Tax=Pandoraea capi TaxID=2508286 RepID=A0ABY6VPE4_9BURK|nr:MULTISPECIES: PP0621 family protein [Pandoraea]ODP34901.1 hypothetical protein A9762_12670 [Pandoraea sp. ISTKB]VVD72006.1 hypothetical protein PCA20602_00676 [Pandoraea capi]
MRNILLLLLLLIAGTWWMRHNERKRMERPERNERNERDERMRTSPGSGGRTTARQSLPPAERMVRCSECDTYLPESESLAGPGDKHFCSAAHRDAHLAREHRA